MRRQQNLNFTPQRQAMKNHTHRLLQKSTRVAALAALALGFASMTSVKAELVLDNTPGGEESFFTGFGAEAVAQGFLTSAGSWTLDSVLLDAESFFGSGSFAVSIYSDVSSQPGSLIATLSGSAPTTRQLYTYTPTSTLTLNGLTRYWITTLPVGSGEFLYSVYGTTGTPTGSWQVPAGSALMTLDSGSSWFNDSETAGFNFAFQINATSASAPIPEPGTWAAAALLAGAAAFLRWRKRREAVDAGAQA